ncbi:MAG TPA: tRNA dihydrouridine synthase DusB [Clostridia bacterium]|nr:tRNA dihydrouridine synthase DusB [Clostridia bacterium]
MQSSKVGLWIGGLWIDAPVFMAPMAGITDRAFRLLVREFGCGLLYTEMVAARPLVKGDPYALAAVRVSSDERPVAAQILGADPELMADAAEVALEQGADVLDINMGCPVKKVVKKGEGAALMCDFERACAVARAVVRRASSFKAKGAQAMGVPVTVKIRKGWEGTQELAPELAVRLEAEGIAAITVHGRTVEQGYSGRADWGTIKRVKERVRIPVVGNGDILTPKDGIKMIEETGCDAVMVGRAALGRPWFPAQVLAYLKVMAYTQSTHTQLAACAKGNEPGPQCARREDFLEAACRQSARLEPSFSERMGIAKRHLDLLVSEKGEKTACLLMRSHGAWYLRGFAGAAEFRRRLQQASTRKEFEQLFSLAEAAVTAGGRCLSRKEHPCRDQD